MMSASLLCDSCNAPLLTAYPPERRAEFEEAVDTQLERALDVLAALRIFGGDRTGK